MKLRYFLMDDAGQLRRVSPAAVEALWQGCRRAATLGCTDDRELRLVSVLCDAKLLPRKIYVLRVPLTAGRFTEENYLTLHLFTRPDCVTSKELLQHHAAGWPRSLRQQLALALDVPIADLPLPFKIGGPLFLAAALKLTPRQAVRYLH